MVLAGQLERDMGEVVAALFPHVATEVHDGAPRWVLKPSLRRRLLADFNPAKNLPLPPAASTHESKSGKLLRTWLAGKLTDLPQTIQKQPDALRQVAGWLSDSERVVPKARQVLRGLALDELRAKYERTASKQFVGRKNELYRLEKLTHHDPWIAIVAAPGGMGKSALLAKFLLRQKAFTANGPIAIVLDLDNPGLTPSRPDLAYAEMARQAAIQVDDFESVEKELRDNADGAETSTERHPDSGGYNDLHTDSLGRSMFERLVKTGRAVFLALDTFERPRQAIPKLLDTFLERLITNVRTATQSQQRPDAVRLIVAGRGPIDSKALVATGAKTIELGPLDRDRAAKLLAELDVESKYIHQVLDRFDAAPLTLRLAAQALDRGASEILNDDDAMEAVRRARGNGYLQLRILDHLPTERLAEVAKRALLLGTITPRRIQTIVGPLLKPHVGETEADELFQDLAKVVEIVTFADAAERSLVLREEVADDIAELSAVLDRDMVVEVRQRAVQELGTSAELADRRDVQRHQAWLAELAKPGPVQSPGNLESFTPTVAKTTSIVEVRREFDSLMGSNRLSEALAVVDDNQVAQSDVELLVKAARAARRLGDADRCERFAELAKLVVTTDLERAQVSVMIIWAIGRRGDASNEARAHLRALQEDAREAWDDGASAQGTVIDRAEVVAALADADREWARRTLEQMFDEHGWASLADAETDLMRQVCALVASSESLEWAAKLGGFDGAYPGKLQVEGLAAALVDLGPGYLGLGEHAGDVEVALLARQKSGELGRLVVEVLSQLRSQDPASQARVYSELANLLDQFRGVQRRTVQVDFTSRGEALETLTTSLTKNLELTSWRELIQSLGDGRITRRAMSDDLGLAVRGGLTEIDRRGRGRDFAKALNTRGLDAEATLVLAALGGDDEVLS
ncbi:MAG TPA: hypothetical protein VM261_04265 [Kofleriaceae bacterium]|nr:hypothetical protein [Kofleriaceae bacterium]